MVWATSASGITCCRKTNETLETYGDTILKFAATMLAYELKKNKPRAGEGEIEAAKVVFVTNIHLFRVGNHLRL